MQGGGADGAPSVGIIMLKKSNTIMDNIALRPSLRSVPIFSSSTP